jgi:hypothetical protein
VTRLLIPLTPTTAVQLELVALHPSGPYRLTVNHPATRFVEYYKTSAAAVERWNELEGVLSGAFPNPDDLRPAA